MSEHTALPWRVDAPDGKRPMIRSGDTAVAEERGQLRYSRWRHGGWYTNIRYPNGAVGCVSNNYTDKKWRIVCYPLPHEECPTFSTRDDAAKAEWIYVQGLIAIDKAANKQAVA